MAAVVLVAAAAAVLLARSTSDPSPSEAARRAAMAASASAAARPVTPVPPYDRRPGRTPIPAPDRVGDRLTGILPGTGPPGRAAATRAIELVLGRYCDDPAAYAYPLGPEASGVVQDWRHLTVALFRIERGASTPSLILTLEWAEVGYRWTGPDDLLAGC